MSLLMCSSTNFAREPCRYADGERPHLRGGFFMLNQPLQVVRDVRHVKTRALRNLWYDVIKLF